MRGFRVEDAMSYMDQVKMEYHDRPCVYREFIDIMKSFKSHTIDKPGVIWRIASLFHGNHRLVLGFNTFLPEGYSIELPQDGSEFFVYREPRRVGVRQIRVFGSGVCLGENSDDVSTISEQTRVGEHSLESRNKRSRSASDTDVSSARRSDLLANKTRTTSGNIHTAGKDQRTFQDPADALHGGNSERRLEEAMIYMDVVKMEYHDRPDIYREFLDIMKIFKSHAIDTPGVIMRIASLFHGNHRLVLGFNTFLPEGYSIELPQDGSEFLVYREPGRSGVTQIRTVPQPTQYAAPGMREHRASEDFLGYIMGQGA